MFNFLFEASKVFPVSLKYNRYNELYFLFFYGAKRDSFELTKPVICEQMWDYKEYSRDNHKKYFKKFTDDLANAINKIIVVNEMNYNYVHLVSVPSSRNVCSSIDYSIKKITNNEDYSYCIDASDTLVRIREIQPAHQGYRLSMQEQKNTIKCNRSFDDDDYIILIDDVYSSGASMDACVELLLEHGIPRGQIMKLAIAKTLYYDKEYKNKYDVVNVEDYL